MAKVRFGKHSINLPQRRWVRLTLGVALVLAGGLGGWLPILGFWMVPLGLLVLSTDIPAVRRWNRRMTVKALGWWRGRVAARERAANAKAAAKDKPLRDSSLVP